MTPWQAPQSSPAQQAFVTAATVSAPPSMASLTSRSVTARQMQTYIPTTSLNKIMNSVIKVERRDPVERRRQGHPQATREKG